MSTFVAVGNSKKSFRRLLDIVVQNISVLPQPVFVQNGYTEFSHRGIRHSDFLSKSEFDRKVEDAKVVITHGGGWSPNNLLDSREEANCSSQNAGV